MNKIVIAFLFLLLLPSGIAQTWEIKVLTIDYFPLKNGEVDITITRDWNDPSLDNARAKTRELADELVEKLGEASRYHGYKDQTAKPSLRYTVVERKEFLRPILRTDNPQWGFVADHLTELNELKVCDYVDNKGVKEIWIFMYHNDPPKDEQANPIKDDQRYYVAPTESNMAMGTKIKAYWNKADFGDVSNSFLINDLPVCKNTYTVYEYNYGREIGEALHNHGHQLEALFHYLDGSDAKPRGADGLFWKRFVGSEYKENKLFSQRCGWVHYPPNIVGQGEYNYVSLEQVQSDCEDWKPEGGKMKSINCENWGCTHEGFVVWWMQNIPGKDNVLSYNGQSLRNWWEFAGDFDSAIKKGKSLTIPNKCRDGTESGLCSAKKPFFCNEGRLVANCNRCGCETGICESTGKCSTSCSDGTMFNSCSAKKPLFCKRGILVENCTQCGCAQGLCTEKGCKLNCDDGTSEGMCSTQKPLFCKNLSLIRNCAACGCETGSTCTPSGCARSCNGTKTGTCGPKPLYCEQGVFYKNCNKCGCSQGELCNNGTGECFKPQKSKPKKLTTLEKLKIKLKNIFP